MQHEFRKTLADFFRARFPVVYIETHEEERALRELLALAEDASLIKTTRRVFLWARTTGVYEVGHQVQRGTETPERASRGSSASSTPRCS